MEMTEEEKQAYSWALKQGFQSVSARYARILAKYIQRQQHALPDVLEALKDLLAWANIHDEASEQARQVRDNAIAAIEACKST